MIEVNFYDPDYYPDARLSYSIIVTRYKSNWIFVRHHQKDTWEIPGGHIEDDELPFEAAKRELVEETGALEYVLTTVSTYSVTGVKSTGYGRLYFAEVFSTGMAPDTSEIAEIKAFDTIPDELTYPDIQPHLFEQVLLWLETWNKI